MARHANAMAARLQTGLKALGWTLMVDSPTNQIFPVIPNTRKSALDQLCAYEDWCPGPTPDTTVIRFVTCFATTAEVARLLERDFGIDDDYISELSFEAPRIGFECGAVLEPVAAENKNHPVSFGFGLVLEFAGFTYYLSGDTDVLVDNVQCDVLFVVCDGIWNMPDYEKSVPAQVAAMDVLPGLVVPYHYGVDAPSTKENGARLCAALTAAGIPCREWKKGLF